MNSKIAVKKFLKSQGKRAASALFAALNEEVQTLLAKAAKRAERNKRSTVMPYDL